MKAVYLFVVVFAISVDIIKLTLFHIYIQIYFLNAHKYLYSHSPIYAGLNGGTQQIFIVLSALNYGLFLKHKRR